MAGCKILPLSGRVAVGVPDMLLNRSLSIQEGSAHVLIQLLLA